MEAILYVLMGDLGYAELGAMYLVHMRRLIIPLAAQVLGIPPVRMRTFERRFRTRCFRGQELTLVRAREAIAALYESLSYERQDEVVRNLISRMTCSANTKDVLWAYHRSQERK